MELDLLWWRRYLDDLDRPFFFFFCVDVGVVSRGEFTL